MRERSASMGMMEDKTKRKREEMEKGKVGRDKRKDGLYGIFKQSRKTLRSAVKKEGEEEQEKLKGMMKEMMEGTRRIWGRLEESLGEIRREMEGLKRREEEWRVEKESMKSRIDVLEKKLEKGEGGK